MSPFSTLAPEAVAPGALATPAFAPRPATAALDVPDRLRRRSLVCVRDHAAPGEADVLVIDLAPGRALPAAGALPRLVLSDDPAMAADQALAGVLPRASSARRVAAAVAALAEGLVVRAPAHLAPPEMAAADGTPPAPPPALTPREREILGLLGEGLPNKAIARRLGISAHTVKYHLEAVFAKLAARSRAEALAQGLRHRLVQL
ncbi:MAG: helix-turn-helix transcriptional regulator [Rhodospirillales bacterium]|nr:helix-turn-helix transcriptional regulator [Rhodospirillales bacterium]